MATEILERRFSEVGARITIENGPWRGMPRIDIATDRRGEHFDLRFPNEGEAVEIMVVDAKPADRHLLLLVRNGGEKSKFLCGHDERHWFVAAIPESERGVTGVVTAKAALQPDAVRAAIGKARPKDPLRRRNTAYVRQGEWFFVPAPGIEPPDALVLRREPLTRGRGGTAHLLERAFRRGGDTVYVNSRHPAGISAKRFARLSESERRNGRFVPMVRDPELYAKGAVRHPDHATVVLPGWHRVLMNTESGARAMQHVAFLD